MSSPLLLLISIADLLPLFCSVNLLLKFVVDVLFIDVDDDDCSNFLPLEEEEEEEEQDLKDATRVVVTLDDKIMEDNIFRVVVSLCVMCDVYKRSRNDVSMLPLLLSSNKRRNQKQQKLKQEQKRGATCLRKRNQFISSEEIEELSLLLSLTLSYSLLLSFPRRRYYSLLLLFMGLVKYSTSGSSVWNGSRSKMEAFFSFLQKLFVFVFVLATFFPYVQYHEFLQRKETMQSSQEQLERSKFKLERNLREMTTKASHREQDARQAETKLSKVEKEVKEKERRNQALEISQQTLQKKLDGCVKDRTSLSEEVTTSTTKVNEVARIESKLERCKHDNLDLNAMTKELRTELTTLEKELKQEVKLRKQAEKASAAQREMATKIKNSLLAMQQAEDKAEKEKARAQVLKRLAKAEKAANATKRKNEEGEDEDEDDADEVDDDFDDDEDEELKPLKAKRKNRKKGGDDEEEEEEEYDDLAHRKIVADDDENVEPGSRAHEAEKRLRFEKKKSMKKERWSAGGLDKDLNGRLNVDRLRKTPKLTRAEGIQGTSSSRNAGGSSSAAELARARAMRDEP